MVIDELAETPEQSLHLPEPRDERLRVVTDLLPADPERQFTSPTASRLFGELTAGVN